MLDEKTIYHRKLAQEKRHARMTELGATRKDQIEKYYGNNPELFEIEQEYGKYLYVPLDIPKIKFNNLDNFKDWWEVKSAVVSKKRADLSDGYFGFDAFKAIDIINEFADTAAWETNQAPEFIELFPEIIEQMQEYIPYTRVLSTNIWSSTKNIPEHRDSSEFIDAPGTFRIMLNDENPSPTLYLIENPLNPFECGELTHVARLEDSNAFCWNNLRCMHGSTHDPKYVKHLMLMIGLFDIKKYRDLIERSVSKYKDQCMVSNYSIENFVYV